MAHRWKVSSLSLFYKYYFVRCASELSQLVPLPYFRVRLMVIFNRLYDFSVTILSVYKDMYVKSFFPCTGRLWNSIPLDCFPLTYDLNGFKSKVNRHRSNSRSKLPSMIFFFKKIVLSNAFNYAVNIGLLKSEVPFYRFL